MAPLSFREATASKRLLWLLTEKLKLGLTSERHESIQGMWPLLVSKLRGLGVSLGLPLACPSFSGPESFFGGWGSAPFLGSLWCWLFLVFGYESPGGFPVVAPVL